MTNPSLPAGAVFDVTRRDPNAPADTGCCSMPEAADGAAPGTPVGGCSDAPDAAPAADGPAATGTSGCCGAPAPDSGGCCG